MKQRVAVAFQSHQSSEHFSIKKRLFVLKSQRKSDPGGTSLHSYIDHVLEEVKPGKGTDLISVMEK